MKKLVFTICFVLVLFLCFASSAFASEAGSTSSGYWSGNVFYSPMSEPVATDNIKWWCASTGQGRENRLMMISVPYGFQISVEVVPSTVDQEEGTDGEYGINCYLFNADGSAISAGTSVPVYTLEYNLLTGAFIRHQVHNTSSSVPGYVSFNTIYSWQDYPFYWTAGCTVNLSSSYGPSGTTGPSLMKINWNGASERGFFVDTFPAFASYVKSCLDNIDNSTHSSLDELLSIHYLLDDVYLLLGQYYPEYLSSINEIRDYLEEIYDRLFNSETEYTTDSAFGESASDVIGAEEALTQDLEGGFSSAFDQGEFSSGNTINNNLSAFQFIRASFQSFILDIKPLHALIIYCLMLGVVVMLLGRRIYV